MSRKIQQKMFEYIDARLKKNGAAQNAIEKKDARSLFIYAAESCVGIREEGGNNRGPMVKLIQKTSDGSADNEAWCMAFVMTCLAYVEQKLGIVSPVFNSEHCMTTWTKTPKVQRVKSVPLPGAIIIWKKGATSSGHTGIVSEYRGKTMEAIEGNTNAGIVGGKIENDGGGVYLTDRSTSGTGSMKVVGYIKPF